MIWWILAAHVLVVVVLAARPWSGRVPLVLAAVPPLAAALVSTWWLSTDATRSASVEWVEGLGLELAFRIDPLTTGLGLIVSAIGVGVFVYATGYFSGASPRLSRFSATLLAFSGSMLGGRMADALIHATAAQGTGYAVHFAIAAALTVVGAGLVGASGLRALHSPVGTGSIVDR